MYRFDPGATSQTIYFRLRDSASGAAKTGLTATSPGAFAAYTRKGASATPIGLVALGSPSAAWTSGGFVEVSSVDASGLYRLDIPNAALAAGVPYVIANIGFTNTLGEAALIRLELVTSNIGAGSIAFTVTITDSVTTLPVSGALVWVSTDVAGTNVVAGALTTNAFGQVIFFLNTGTYYVFVSRSGYTVTNPTTISVS